MRDTLKILSAITVSGLILASCNKSDVGSSTTAGSTGLVPHVYGVNTNPDAATYANVPVYNASQIKEMFAKGAELDAAGPVPSAYSLVTPAVRDQEQIGSCTGFCGTEANEITQYYGHSNTWGPNFKPIISLLC